jgi:hypothetical protein
MPTIASVQPLSGQAGETVTIRGAGFAAGCTVRIGATNALADVVSAQEVRAIVPADLAGSVDVAVDDAVLPLGFYALAATWSVDRGALLQGGARAVYLDGLPVGLLDGPVRLAHELSLAEAETNAELNPVRLFKRRERWRLSLTLAEISLANLRLAFDGTAREGALGLGGDPTVHEHGLLVTGPGPSGASRDFYAYRAVVEQTDALALAREAP